VVVAPAAEPFDAEAWLTGPVDGDTFGEWVSQGAQNKDAVRAALKAGEDFRFGRIVSDMAAKKHMSDTDLAEEGVDLSDLTDDSTTEPVTDGTTTDEDDATEVASTQRGGSSTSHGTGGGNGGNGGGSSNGNGSGNGSGRGHN
jgi:hypothetical protein